MKNMTKIEKAALLGFIITLVTGEGSGISTMIIMMAWGALFIFVD